MNILLNLNFNNPLNTIKTAFQSLSPQQQKIISIVTIILASFSFIGIAYRYCFKAKQDDSGFPDIAPKTMAAVFKKHHYNPNNLPLLDMTQFGDSSDYIHYITPDHMTSPVMRFKDAWGRNGIALHIHGKDSSTREWSIKGIPSNQPGPVSELNSVWTFHQRYVSEPTYWVGGADYRVNSVFDTRHKETDHVGNPFTACPHCPTNFGVMSDALLENLLTGKDLDFQLGTTPNFNLFTA